MQTFSSGFAYWRRRIDWPLMIAVGVLLSVGMIAVYSAVSPMGSAQRYMFKQTTAIVLGMAILFVLSNLNYQLFRSHPGVLYALTILLLVAVMVIGKRIYGAKSWIVLGPFSFEPVELAKIGFVLVLAGWLDRPEIEISSWRVIAAAFGLAAGHMLLILKAPDLGGTLVYPPIVMSLLFFAGVRPLYLLALIFFGGVAVGIPVISIYFSVQPQLLHLHPILNFFAASAKEIRVAIEMVFLAAAGIFTLWWFLRKFQFRIPWQYPLFLSLIVALGVMTAQVAEHSIKDYQRKRIVVFLSPSFDPLGAGYNITQSVIAVGSGRIFGKGLFSGSQTQLGFLPAKHTDFIFSVIGEELGFMWACIILGALGVIVWRAFMIAAECQDRYGALVAVGLGCLIGFESVVNIGMVLGLLPITGVALPFVSYGGSHILTSLMSVGLLQSVNFRRYIY